ncbi:hypothetical protein GCM10010402_31770 [Actinomadura luteofluorescens]
MGAEKHRAPPPAPHGALPPPTAPHSTPLFPTVNKKNTVHAPFSTTKSQVNGGGVEWGPAAPLSAPHRREPARNAPARGHGTVLRDGVE